MNIKKSISKIIRYILPKKFYVERRSNSLFIIYAKIELFVKTLSLRFEDKMYFLLPSRHIGAIYLLNKLKKTFANENKEFFLWDASLLGLARGQKAIAGSASDIDIAMIFNKNKHLKFILSLKKNFKMRILNNYDSIQLFHKFGQIDITLFKKKGINFEVNIIDVTKQNRKFNLRNADIGGLTLLDKSITKKLFFHKKKFLPFKTKKIYFEKYLVPNEYLHIVKKTYGPKWKIPDKKNQVYFV